MKKTIPVSGLLAAVYAVWITIHLTLFFTSEETIHSNRFFWPFIPKERSVTDTYDLLEFLVYSITPLFLYLLYWIFFPADPTTTEDHEHRNHFSQNFFIAFLNEKIKAEELSQKLNELSNKPVDDTYLIELKRDREIALKKGPMHWIGRHELKKKYQPFSQQYDR